MVFWVFSGTPDRSSDPTRLAASDVRAACDAMRNAVLDGAKSLLGGLHVGCATRQMGRTVDGWTP